MKDIKIKDNSKNQILDAALKVVVNKGYAQTRMDDIVSQSGLSKGALYHHYPSKKDLFIARKVNNSAKIILRLKDSLWEVISIPNEAYRKPLIIQYKGFIKEIFCYIFYCS